MNIESITLFLHIAGSFGLFLALGLEWVGLRQIRKAMNPEQVRGWMGIQKSVQKVGFASMLTTVVTGITMTLMEWGGAAWILVTMASLFLVIGLSAALTGPQMKELGRALVAGKGSLSTAFRSAANQPLLWISIQTRIAIVLGIVFLKTAKPGIVGSLLTLGAAIILGVASALPLPRREQAQEGSTD